MPPPKIIWTSRDGRLVQYHIPGEVIGKRFPVLLVDAPPPETLPMSQTFRSYMADMDEHLRRALWYALTLRIRKASAELDMAEFYAAQARDCLAAERAKRKKPRR